MSVSTGVVTTLVGDGTDGTEDGTGTGSKILVTLGSRLTSDAVNFLFFTQEDSIRKIDISTQKLTTILNSNEAREDIDGSLLTAKSYFPSGIVYSPEGLFFSNYFGIRRLR